MLTAAIVTYTAVSKAKLIAEKAQMAWLNIMILREKAHLVLVGLKTSALKTMAIVQMALTREIKLTTAAQMLWNKVLLANPITAVIAVVAGLTAAIVTLSKETSTAEQAQRDYNDAVTDANKQAAEEEASIMRLVSAIQSNTTAESDRKAALEELNGKLEDVYKKGVAAIREVDSNHIILLGGAQWNGNFKPFKDSKFDDKIMYTCHRYGGEPTQAAIQTIINFRDSVNLPMYMGEIGHNTDEWQAAFCQTMRENNIGYTFWPYKKMDGSSFVGITPPENWANIVYFSEAPRATYKEIREARPAQAMSRKAMMDFIEACKLKNCVVQEGYIRSLGMK